MKFSAVHKHIQPMALGIMIGSILGLCLAIPGLMAVGFIKHRMYYSISCVLRESINTYVLAACVTAYAFHIGRMLKGWLSFFICISAAAGFLGFIGTRFGLYQLLSKYIFKDLNLNFVKAIFSQGFLQIIAAVIIIAVGIIFMRRTRQNGLVEVTSEDRTESDLRAETPASISTTALKRSAYLSAAVLVAFLGMNSLPTVLRVKNAHDVRKAPNIIYIMVDTLRADHLGCYGYSRNTSPNIDKFASQSLRFDKAISQAPWTTASIASFMSSRYLHTGMGIEASIPSNVVLMPELFKDRGYVTGAVISNSLAGKSTRLDRGYQYYYEMQGDEIKNIQGKYIIPSTVVSESLSMLKQMKDRRFFMFAHFMGPHSPYASHKEYNFFPGYKGKLSRDGVFVEGCHYYGDDLEYAKALYDGEIAYTDQYIGLLLSELRKMNLYDNTLIVLLADHGEEFQEHGKMSHGEHLYDETIHVPLIVKLPEQKTGSVVHGAFPLINLLASITRYVHWDTSALEFQGTPVPLRGLRSVRETDIYSSTDFHEARLQSLRSETSKLIVDINSDKKELYDLRKDPGEEKNIAADSVKTTAGFETALQSMNTLIDEALKDTVVKPFTPEEAQAVRKSLRSLGYLQ